MVLSVINRLCCNFLGDSLSQRHPNRINSSRVTAILLNGWILPIDGASAVKGLQSTELPCLVYATWPLTSSIRKAIKEEKKDYNKKKHFKREAHLKTITQY